MLVQCIYFKDEQKFKGRIALLLLELILLVLIREPIPADFRQYLCIQSGYAFDIVQQL